MPFDCTGENRSATGGLSCATWRLDGLIGSRTWNVTGGKATFSYDGAKRPTKLDKAGSAPTTISQAYDRAGDVTVLTTP